VLGVLVVGNQLLLLLVGEWVVVQLVRACVLRRGLLLLLVGEWVVVQLVRACVLRRGPVADHDLCWTARSPEVGCAEAGMR
jgi:hypothetical protein